MPAVKKGTEDATNRYRALTRLRLRQSSDPTSPLWGEWLVWEQGVEFVPPPHMNIARAIERGIAEEVGIDG